MNSAQNHASSQVYYRIVALWVLCEAMLGGIIHALKIPVSGLFVGSAAVLCICLIANQQKQKGIILKATLIVCIFKMMLSPQAPPLAYFAVLFQGVMGEVIFFNRRFYKLSCFLLAIIALLESGMQRIAVLTIVYGNDFWKAVNQFFSELLKTKTNYSLWIAGVYVAIHLLAGIAVGYIAATLPAKAKKWKRDAITAEEETAFQIKQSPHRNKIKLGVLIIWLLLMSLYLQSYFEIGKSILPQTLALRIFIRSAIIIIAWYFFIGPALSWLVKAWLQKKQKKFATETSTIAGLLPSVQKMILTSWKNEKHSKGLKRIIRFCKAIVAHTLVPPGEKRIIIFTGPVHAGKTTALMHWCERRQDIGGILTPVINGKRFFWDNAAKEFFAMEADEEEEKIAVGKYQFRKAGFEKAIQRIKQNTYKPWLVIDEIGPLELRGEGFAGVLKEVLEKQNGRQTILLVAREQILNEVIQQFGLQQAIIIKRLSEIDE